jgi:hypothetical protein
MMGEAPSKTNELSNVYNAVPLRDGAVKPRSVLHLKKLAKKTNISKRI